MGFWENFFGGSGSNATAGAGANGTFNGQHALIEQNGNHVDIYYGGQGNPLGPGHGHVVTNNDGGVGYYRQSAAEGGAIIANSRAKR